MIPQPFYCTEQRPLAVTATSASVTFTSSNASAQLHLRVVNYGAKGCQLNIGGATAVITSSAAGTNQVYVGAGEDVVFTKQGAILVSAICDGTDTTSLALHIGVGS